MESALFLVIMDFPPLSQMKEKFAAGSKQTVQNSKAGGSTGRGDAIGASASGGESSSSNGVSSASATGSLSFAEVITGKKTSLGRDWSPLLGENKLSYHKPLVKDGKRLVHLPANVCEKASKIWEDSLVAQFVGQAPRFSQIHNAANLLWGRRSPVTVMAIGNEAYIFRFCDAATSDWVLNSGPWYIGNRPVFLKKYEKGLTVEKLSTSSFPIWLKLWHIPMDYFSTEGIGYIASGVGEPICLDKATEERRRIDYARVCVKVLGSDDLPETVEVDVEGGGQFTVTVEYPWKPQRCSACKTLGHFMKQCPKFASTWVPKQSQTGLGGSSAAEKEATNTTKVTEERASVPQHKPVPTSNESSSAAEKEAAATTKVTEEETSEPKHTPAPTPNEPTAVGKEGLNNGPTRTEDEGCSTAEVGMAKRKSWNEKGSMAAMSDNYDNQSLDDGTATEVASVTDDDILDPYAEEVHYSPQNSKKLKGKGKKRKGGGKSNKSK